jgi:hypothetical protein
LVHFVPLYSIPGQIEWEETVCDFELRSI